MKIVHPSLRILMVTMCASTYPHVFCCSTWEKSDDDFVIVFAIPSRQSFPFLLFPCILNWRRESKQQIVDLSSFPQMFGKIINENIWANLFLRWAKNSHFPSRRRFTFGCQWMKAVFVFICHPWIQRGTTVFNVRAIEDKIWLVCGIESIWKDNSWLKQCAYSLILIIL